MGRRWVKQAAAGVRNLRGKVAPEAQTFVERRVQRHGWPTQGRLVQAALVWPLCAASWAQSTPPAPVPVPDTPGLEISDRVKRDAERPMYWIRRLGEQTAGQDKANQERSATERQNAADKAAGEKAAERLAAERAARAARAEKTEKQAVSAPRPPLPEPTPTPALATRDSVASRPDSASNTAASPAAAPAPAPALAEVQPGGSAPEVPIASASSPSTAADPAPHNAGTADVAMATPPHHADGN